MGQEKIATILIENIPQLVQNSNPDIHEAQQTLSRTNKSMPDHIIVKPLKIKE